VSAVGTGAEGPGGPISEGDEVIGFRIPGAYADRLVVPAGTLVPKPAGVSFEQAGGLMLTGATAVHALTVTEVGPGDTVLIHGASGGVGHMAVQLARITGARVIGTASEANHAFLRELGAEPVTYGNGLVERVRALAPDGVDAVVDAVGGDAVLDASLALAGQRERIATIVPGPRAFEAGIKVLGGAPRGDPGTEIRAAARPRLADLAGEGRLRVTVAATYPLAEVAEAHRRLAAGHTRGKIILIP
jgi:NADPH:quinone reductase-like Zn-dependent oxidoreductase